MDAKLSPSSVRRRGPWSVGPWILAIPGLLVVAGLLIQACSDNNGTSGPKFAGGPAGTTGFANTAADIKVQVAINPNTITPGQRAGVTAIATNLNGQPLAGKKVQFSTDVGSLDVTVGTTNASGQFSTSIRISATDVANAGGKTSATVTAFVEGAFGIGIVNFGPNPTPAPLTLTPPSVTLTQAAIAGFCSFTAQFTAAGGTPPLIFSSGIPGAVDGSGLYSRTGVNAVAQGTTITDTVTVTDAAGQTASASVSLTCNP
jgi:hypothetical protein